MRTPIKTREAIGIVTAGGEAWLGSVMYDQTPVGWRWSSNRPIRTTERVCGNFIHNTISLMEFACIPDGMFDKDDDCWMTHEDALRWLAQNPKGRLFDSFGSRWHHSEGDSVVWAELSSGGLKDFMRAKIFKPGRIE